MQRSARAQVVVSGCGRLRTSGSVADQESRSSVNKLEFVPLVEIMELDFDMGEDPISMEQALDIVVQSSEDLDMKLDDPGSPKLKQDENSRPKRTIPLKVPPARKKAREPSPSEVARSSDFSPSGFSPELSSAFGSALSLSEDRKKQAEKGKGSCLIAQKYGRFFLLSFPFPPPFFVFFFWIICFISAFPIHSSDILFCRPGISISNICPRLI